jgi:LPS sulfotransferase NodH
MRAAGGRSPEDPLFIVASHRSGSSMVREALNTVPGVQLADEALNPHTFPVLAKAGPTVALPHLDRHLRACRGTVVGAKIMVGHLHRVRLPLAEIVERWPRARHLVLYRRDLLAQFVSGELAKQTGQWRLREGETRRAGRLTVDVERLGTFVRKQHRRYEAAMEATDRARRVVLSYEELVEDRVGELADLTRALEIPGEIDLSAVTLRRQQQAPIDWVVENEAEVAQLGQTSLVLDLAGVDGHGRKG